MNKIQIGPFLKRNISGQLFIIEPIENQFSFGYVLYIPNSISKNTTLIVEGSNSNKSNKDIDEAIKEVYKEATNPLLPIYSIATDFGMPLLYPLFPRWNNGEETIYNQMLSSNSLNINTKGLIENKLLRVDLQLINMISNAKDILKAENINIDNKIIIDGFSASAKFANRFTLLHPKIIKLCIGGGISGALTLPIEYIKDEKLLWPVGIGNLKELLGDDININMAEFKKVRQFYYMGKNDINDPFSSKEDKDSGILIPDYPSIISSDELKQMYKYIGKISNKDRLEKIQELYKESGINVRFEIYDCEHVPYYATDDIKEEIDKVCHEQILKH